RGRGGRLTVAELEGGRRQGCERGVETARRSGGGVSFQTASLYPVLYRLEKKGLIAGRWVEAPGQRRRRYYRLTPAGRKMLSEQRRSWRAFLSAIQRAGGLENA